MKKTRGCLVPWLFLLRRQQIINTLNHIKKGDKSMDEEKIKTEVEHPKLDKFYRFLYYTFRLYSFLISSCIAVSSFALFIYDAFTGYVGQTALNIIAVCLGCSIFIPLLIVYVSTRFIFKKVKEDDSISDKWNSRISSDGDMSMGGDVIVAYVVVFISIIEIISTHIAVHIKLIEIAAILISYILLFAARFKNNI